MKRSYAIFSVVLILAMLSLACGLGGIVGGGGDEAPPAEPAVQDSSPGGEQGAAPGDDAQTSGQETTSTESGGSDSAAPQDQAQADTQSQDDSGTGSDTTAAEGGASAGGSGEEFEVAPIDTTQASALDNLSSYRSELSMVYEGTTQGQPVNGTINVRIEATTDPAAQHMFMDVQGTTLGEEGPEMLMVEMYLMGDTIYLYNSEMGWTSFTERDTSAFTEGFFAPQDIVELPPNARRKLVPETVNGVLSWHYVLDKDAFDDQDFAFEEVRGDAWIAVDGGFMVKLDLFGQGRTLNPDPSADFFEEGSMQINYNLTEVNGNFDIVLPPEAEAAAQNDLFNPVGGGEWTRQDIPLPADAEIELAMEGLAQVFTGMSIEEATAFMQGQLEANGWVVSGEPLVTEAGAFVDFVKGNETVSLVIGQDTDGSGRTSIFITIQ
ncbi:MAG: hypothetical protein ACE5H9_12320 [Anaerolineae bacterium]